MTLLKVTPLNVLAARAYGINVYRWKKGLAPRFAYSALSETPEFSYLDGKGPAPMNKAQRKRYERDQEFGRTIIKYMKQFERAKQLAAEQKVANSQPALPSQSE